MDKEKFVERAYESAAKALDRASAAPYPTPEDLSRIAQCWAYLAADIAGTFR